MREPWLIAGLACSVTVMTSGLTIFATGHGSPLAMWIGLIMGTLGLIGLVATLTALARSRTEERTKRHARQARERMLAEFLGRGQGLGRMLSKRVGVTRESFHLTLDDSVREWIEEVEQYLLSAFGQPYLVRFRQDATLPDWGAIPIGEFRAWTEAYEAAVRQRCKNLESILSELQRNAR